MLEVTRQGGVSAKHDLLGAYLYQVAIKAAVHVAAHASAPVRHLEGSHLGGTHLRRFIPTQLVNPGVALRPQQIRRPLRGYDAGSPVLETPQAGQVEVIHVSVREKHQIDGRQFRDLGCYVG